MIGVLSALAPVFGLIAVGYLLKSRRIFTDDFWDPAERLTFYFLFPALLITSIGGAEAVGPDLLPMATALVVATGLMAGAMIALRPRRAFPGRRSCRCSRVPSDPTPMSASPPRWRFSATPG